MPKGNYDPDKEGSPLMLAMKMTPNDYFERVNKLLKDNPTYPEDDEFLNEFADLGIGVGRCFDSLLSPVDLEKFWQEMKDRLIPKLIKKTSGFMVKNRSFKFYGEPIGRFGTQYGYRCLVAIAGFGANPIDTAVYLKVRPAGIWRPSSALAR